MRNMQTPRALGLAWKSLRKSPSSVLFNNLLAPPSPTRTKVEIKDPLKGDHESYQKMYCKDTRLHQSPPRLPKTHPLHKVKQSTPIYIIISLLNIQLDNHSQNTTLQSTIQAFVCYENKVKNLSSPQQRSSGS